MITVEALPGGNGDCMWITWTSGGGEHRMLVDGGVGFSGALKPRFAAQPADRRAFDLVVCSHIDNDHINGLLTLFRTPPDGFEPADVWFNSRDHLVADAMGTGQGDKLSRLLAGGPWNTAFGGKAVVRPDTGPLPTLGLPGLTLTVLAPGHEELATLLLSWPETREEPDEPEPLPPDALGDEDGSLADLASVPLDPDPSPSNGSSIALLLEHEDGTRVLLAADVHADVLTAGLRRFGGGDPVHVDLATVPHHGSARNTSTELLGSLDCRHWLVSTNGGGGHGHPSRTAIARILARRDEPVLFFNYRSTPTDEFASEVVALEYGSTVHRPDEGGPSGIRIAVGTSGATPA